MKPVFITTELGGRLGYFFGYVEHKQDLFAEKIHLKDSRSVRRWVCKKGGVFGLAVTGPEKESMIGPTVSECWIGHVTSITPCTKEAEKAWLAATWE